MEEWKHESEVVHLAGMKPEKQRDMLHGAKGGEGETAEASKGHRSEAAVTQLVSEIEWYKRVTG